MLFTTPAYAVFFLVVFTGFWLLARQERPRVLWLLAASYTFYGWWSWGFLGLILFSTLLDYGVGRALDVTRAPGRRRALLGLSLVGNLGVLGFFKYWDFFAAEFATAMTALDVPTDPLLLDLILPVGISFYTFQTLSYTIDLYRRDIAVERDVGRFALFVAFFPQLVAGPIVRARDFLPQIRARPRLDGVACTSACTLIAGGLIKKVIFADVLGASLVDPFWSDPASFGGGLSLLAIGGYAFQIYGDFSGYTDIAIGSAALLGFDLGENFRSPYRSCRPREFWTRWHISLSTWLRDYLYIPLGGNRGTRARTCLNLLLTMLLGGLWHGASWMFVAWGLFHGLLLVADRLLGLRDPVTAWGRWGARLVYFQFTCLGWVLFRSADPGTAAAVLRSLFQTPDTPVTLAPYVLPVLLLAVLTHLASPAFTARMRVGFTRLPGLVQGAAYALLTGLLMQASALDVPFIYFQF